MNYDCDREFIIMQQQKIYQDAISSKTGLLETLYIIVQ
jgi:hypothetical protein